MEDKLKGHPFLSRKTLSSSNGFELWGEILPSTGSPSPPLPGFLNSMQSSDEGTLRETKVAPPVQTGDPCEWCGKEDKPRGRNKYCGRVCYLNAMRASSARICPVCHNSFQAGKYKGQVCCGEECRKRRGVREKKWCGSCGERFTPKRSGQGYCNKKCKSKTQEVGYVEHIEPTAPTPLGNLSDRRKSRNGKASRWHHVVPGQRTMHQFWSWLRYAFDGEGLVALGFSEFEAKDWSQLKHLRIGRDVGMEKLHEVSGRMVNNFHVFREKFKWSGPFRPGQLLGFWDGIVAYTYGSSAAAMMRQYDPNADQDSWGALDGSKDHSDDWGTESSGEPVERKLGKNGRILVTDWKRLPEGRWSASTLWAYLEDHLEGTGFLVGKLTPKNRPKMNALIKEHGMGCVQSVVEAISGKPAVFYSRMRWHGPITPNMVSGFWEGIEKLAKKQSPGHFDTELEKDYDASW